MAKVTFPLFCEQAQGQFGHTLIFQVTKGISIVKKYFWKKDPAAPAQIAIRLDFRQAMKKWNRMKETERFLWQLALKNYAEYAESFVTYTKRWARCLFFHQVLATKSFTWFGSPFPPFLIQMLAADKIENYYQTIADVEILTGLNFCYEVKPYFFPFLGDNIVGLANIDGVAIALQQSYYESASSWERIRLVAHELAHALMDQHLWNYNAAAAMSEEIAGEIALRVAYQELSPIYTYGGKTLSQIVPQPGCS